MSTTAKEGGGGGEEEEEKVIVLFKATGGDTPLLKQRKVKVLRKAKFVDVVAYVSKLLQRAHVFVYLNDAFTPRYDEEVGRLFDWFGSGSGGGGGAGDASGVGGGGGDETKKKQVLVVNYATQVKIFLHFHYFIYQCCNLSRRTGKRDRGRDRKSTQMYEVALLYRYSDRLGFRSVCVITGVVCIT